MHKETENKIIYLYRITCLINNKNYIGQTVDPTSRWRGHRRDSADPKVPIQFAIKKYGTHNFEFEVIATCKGQDNANELETLLVTQYNSFINNEGYNATHGGQNAPKSDNWIQAMKDWHASLSEEERAEISKKQAEATIKQIREKGHPAQGTKRTPEQLKTLSKARLDNPVEYTAEIRERMSEAHIGHKESEETKLKRGAKIQEAWNKRNEIRFATGEIKCNAPGCEIFGKYKYMIINNIRYCHVHGKRLNRTGLLELQPRSSHNKNKPMTAEAKEKARLTRLVNSK